VSTWTRRWLDDDSEGWLGGLTRKETRSRRRAGRRPQESHPAGYLSLQAHVCIPAGEAPPRREFMFPFPARSESRLRVGSESDPDHGPGPVASAADSDVCRLAQRAAAGPGLAPESSS
jgi:hypothetical protein